MNMELWQGLCKLSLFGAFIVFNALVASLGDSAFAQITPDSSLGSESSTLTPNVNVKGSPGTLIEGGATRNLNNLFHSFSEFNVNNGQRVYFSNPAAIENIFTRVTGGNVSNILGTLGVDGNANLFLLNPNGIIFGENASLDVAGSFFATTADSFDFGNGLEFSATNPQAAPLLTMSVTPGLQYGANPGDISSSGNLTVGKDLAIAGGNLDLKGQLNTGKDLTLQAQDTVKVRDSAANPFIATAGNKLTVQGNQAVDIFALNHPESGFFSGGDMVLRSANTVSGDAHYSTGGSFKIEQLDGSLGSLFSPYDPIILANENVTFASYNGPSLHILAGGSVNIGTATINGADTIGNTINQTNSPRLSTVNLSNGTTLQIDGSATPTLDVRAGIDWTQFGGEPGNLGFGVAVPPSAFVSGATRADITIGGISNRLGSSGNGKTLLTNQYAPNGLAGNIQVGSISAYGDLNIDSRGDITASGAINTSGINSNAGNVSLLANGNIVTRDITTVLNSDQVGFAGDIVLTSRNGFIDTRGGTLNSSVNGSFGFAGNVSLTTNGDIFAGNIFSNLSSGAEGNAGNIDITANSVSLTNGAQVASSTFGKGNAGNVTVSAKDTVYLADVAIFSTVEAGGQGTGGNININAATLSLTNGAQLQTLIRGANNTLAGGKGNAGNININATDKVELDGFPTLIVSDVGTGAEGNAGNIDITTGSLSLTNGAEIFSRIFGIGDAGNVKVSVKDTISLANANISTNVSAGGQGRGGNIDITTGSLSLTNGTRISSGTFGIGNAGNITINATDKVELDGFSTFIKSNVATGAEGNAGNIDINTGSVSLTNGAFLVSSTQGIGDAGNVTVSAQDTISLVFSFISTNVEAEGQGTGGNIDIDATTLSLTDGAQLQSGTFSGGKGNAGNVNINATEKVELDGVKDNILYSAIFSTVKTGGEGNAGNVDITTGSLSLTNGTLLSTSTQGIGDAGNVTVSAKDTVSLADGGILSNVQPGGQGTGGKIDITTGLLSLTNGSLIATSTQGIGDAGNVRVSAKDTVSLADANIISTVEVEGQGAGGNIDITAGSVSLSNSASFNSSTSGIGDAGNVTVSTKDKVSLGFSSAILSTVEAGSQGTGGNIDITSGSVSLTNRAFFSSSTSGIGDAGNITVSAKDTISLADSDIFSVVGPGGQGTGGNIDIDATTLSLTDGAQLQTLITPISGTLSAGKGNAGNVKIHTTDKVKLDGVNSDGLPSAIYSFVGTGAEGNGGNIDITTGSVYLTDIAQILSSTLGIGNAGNILVKASDSVEISGFSPYSTLPNGNPGGFSSGLFSTTDIDATGEAGFIKVTTDSLRLENGGVLSSRTQSTFKGGDITVNANALEINSGGQILSTAFKSGNAGDIDIQVRDNLTISGSEPTYNDRFYQVAEEFGEQEAQFIIGPISPNSGIFANTTEKSTGKGGNIKIDPILVTVQNGGRIAVNSQGSGEAGNLELQAERLILDEGNITAQATSNDGGNMDIDVQELFLLRNSSNISTTAGTAQSGGDGGNIEINAPNGFVIATPSLDNNNITANAFEGSGGNITINTQSVIGIQELKEGDAGILKTNDITASSDFGNEGSININSPDVDPASAINTLPQDVVDPSNLIAQGCEAFDEGEISEFTVTGRGGLPPSPEEPFSSDGVWEDIRLQDVDGEEEQKKLTSQEDDKEENSSIAKINPATGWEFNEKGEVTLLSASNATPHTLGSVSHGCRKR